MALLALIVLALQPPSPPAAPTAPADPRRETVIAAPPPEAARRTARVPTRIRRETRDGWVIDSAAAMYLREWAACTVRNNRSTSVALLGTALNSPAQSEALDRLTGRRFTRRTVCARFRSMRVDNLVLRGAIAEALQRWEERRRRAAGPLPRPAAPNPVSSVASLARAGYCVAERQPEAVRRVMATRLGTDDSEEAMGALQEAVDACLPDTLQAADFHPIMLRGALGEPYFFSGRDQRFGGGAVSPAT